jgi:hypothetical protein
MHTRGTRDLGMPPLELEVSHGGGEWQPTEDIILAVSAKSDFEAVRRQGDAFSAHVLGDDTWQLGCTEDGALHTLRSCWLM